MKGCKANERFFYSDDMRKYKGISNTWDQLDVTSKAILIDAMKQDYKTPLVYIATHIRDMKQLEKVIPVLLNIGEDPYEQESASSYSADAFFWGRGKEKL